MLTVNVSLSLTNAKSTLPMETAPHASRDTISSMELVSSLPPIMLNPLTSDAECGIGTTKSASSALRASFSTSTKSVLLLPTSAKPSTALPVTAPPATKAMTSPTDSVSTLPQTTPDPLISAVLLGTGRTKFA